jgi:hypothetical protein
MIPVYKYESPLRWPDGWKRSAWRVASQFKVEPRIAKQAMLLELGRMDATDVVISSNQRANRDGTLSLARQSIYDTGIAVYFTRKGKPVVLACDQYQEIHENIRAIGKTLEAMRSIERWGASDLLDRAFTAFEALPAPEQWWQVLGVSQTAPWPTIEAAFRELMREVEQRGADTWEYERLRAARESAKATRK